MLLRRFLSILVSVSFFLTSLGPLPQARADEPLVLPAPGTMVNLTPAFEPALIKGLTVDKDDPFRFNFIMDAGQSGLSGEALKKVGDRLVRYFFACLTVPEKDLWVNLSPYEKDRIIPQSLGETPLGRDLLAQDYILKQLTASMIYPEKDLGKEFWSRVYAKARQLYGTSQVPVNTFNKVWILADKATVFEQGQTAYVLDGHLKVMLEEDYLALNKNVSLRGGKADEAISYQKIASPSARNDTHALASQIIRTIILPEIEKEVNTGKNFATLRQIFNSLILANWYKKNLKEALLNQVYADKNTVKGVNLTDPTVKERIYQQYLKAYKKGVFNFIKEDTDPNTRGTIPRKYFSGGFGVNPDMETDVKGPGYLGILASRLGRKISGSKPVLFALAVSLSLNQLPASTPAANTISRVATVQAVSLSDLNIQRADMAVLTQARKSWQKYEGLDDILTKALINLDGLGQPYGLATVHTQNFIKFGPETDPRPMLRQQILELFGNNKDINRLFIDGKLQKGGDPDGQYVVNAVSLDNINNLIYGKATGMSIEIYKRQEDGKHLEIITSISIKTAFDTRVIISTDDGVYDYKLLEDGKFQDLHPQGLEMAFNGKYISLEGDSGTWPIAMRNLVRSSLTENDTKVRIANSSVVDVYNAISEGGLMTGWVSRSRAKAIAHLMEHARLKKGRPDEEGGLAIIQTNDGLQDVKNMHITINDLLSDNLVYIYAGVHNLVGDAKIEIDKLSTSNEDKRIALSAPKENLKIDQIGVGETFKEYLKSNLKILPDLPSGVKPEDRDRLQARMDALIPKIVDSLFEDIPLENAESSAEVIIALETRFKGYPEEEKAVLGTNDAGYRYIHNLDYIIKNLPDPGRPVGELNSSGDQQKVLDFIFSQIFTYLMREEVHAIIDEESDDIKYGIGEGKSNNKGVRIVNSLDPVDGSSQLKKGDPISSIFTFGYLRDGQGVEGNIDLRKQLRLPSFDISFGSRTTLTLRNPNNGEGKPEVVRFRLMDVDGKLEFRHDLNFGNMLDAENNNLKWSGLIPDPKKNIGKVLLLAPGGSLQRATVLGHRQFARWLNNCNIRFIFSGTLGSDETEVQLSHDLNDDILGAMFFYPDEKLRQIYEGDYYALMTSLTGGETIDGQQPILNLLWVAQERKKSLSANSMPLYSGSTWLTKLMMSWSYHIQRYSENKGGEKPTEQELDVEWGKFLKAYIQRTSKLISEISEITGQSIKNVRKALLSWDSTDMEDNYFPRLLEMPAGEIAKKLTFDAAMTETTKEVAIPNGVLMKRLRADHDVLFHMNKKVFISSFPDVITKIDAMRTILIDVENGVRLPEKYPYGASSADREGIIFFNEEGYGLGVLLTYELSLRAAQRGGLRVVPKTWRLADGRSVLSSMHFQVFNDWKVLAKELLPELEGMKHDLETADVLIGDYQNISPGLLDKIIKGKNHAYAGDHLRNMEELAKEHVVSNVGRKHLPQSLHGRRIGLPKKGLAAGQGNEINVDKEINNFLEQGNDPRNDFSFEKLYGVKVRFDRRTSQFEEDKALTAQPAGAAKKDMAMRTHDIDAKLEVLDALMGDMKTPQVPLPNENDLNGIRMNQLERMIDKYGIKQGPVQEVLEELKAYLRRKGNFAHISGRNDGDRLGVKISWYLFWDENTRYGQGSIRAMVNGWLENQSLQAHQAIIGNGRKTRLAAAPDAAFTSGPGGIDLNTAGMTTTLRREGAGPAYGGGAGVQMNFDAAMAARIRKDGLQSLTPVIYKITPITNIWPVFGMQSPQVQEQPVGV